MTTITQTIATLPDAPDPATDTPANFSIKAAAMVLAMKAMVLELQTWAGQVNTVKGEINVSAAATAADALATAADAIATAADRVQTGLDVVSAAGSAATAASYATSLSGTSATSVAMGTGAKSFTATTGRQWDVGQFLSIASSGTPADYMIAQVTSYNDGSGALVVNSLYASSGATHSDWSITLSGPKGETGSTGPSGKLIRVLVTGTTQVAANGYDYWLTNVAATAVTAPALVDEHRFKVTPRNGLKTNTIDFGTDTVRGPNGTATGVVTLDMGAPMEIEASSTLNEWGMS